MDQEKATRKEQTAEKHLAHTGEKAYAKKIRGELKEQRSLPKGREIKTDREPVQAAHCDDGQVVLRSSGVVKTYRTEGRADSMQEAQWRAEKAVKRLLDWRPKKDAQRGRRTIL
jgi:hypothetical protein